MMLHHDTLASHISSVSISCGIHDDDENGDSGDITAFLSTAVMILIIVTTSRVVSTAIMIMTYIQTFSVRCSKNFDYRLVVPAGVLILKYDVKYNLRHAVSPM